MTKSPPKKGWIAEFKSDFASLKSDTGFTNERIVNWTFFIFFMVVVILVVADYFV